MAAGEETLYSASRDLSIRAWNPDYGNQRGIVQVRKNRERVCVCRKGGIVVIIINIVVEGGHPRSTQISP